jgi:predicted ribosome quality control (RQC) complex YloA/Tae2 family protein
VSKGIRFDALLVRALAATLDARLRGRRIRALRFATPERRVLLAVRDQTLTWELHPDRGWITLEANRFTGEGLGLPADARIVGVAAPADERAVEIEITGEEDVGGAIRRVVVELFGTHRNAIGVDAAGIVRAVLRPRPRAERVLAVTQPYSPLAPSQRLGADRPPSHSEWHAALDVPEDERYGALLAKIAYTGPVNARWLLAGGDLDAGYERYLALMRAEPEAWVLAPEVAPQPYPARLDDPLARRTPDLLAAFASAAALRLGNAAQDAFVARTTVALEAIDERLARVEVRRARLRDEARGAPDDAAALRRQADLLLAQLHRVPKGAALVELDDFEGGRVVVTLDPGLAPSVNANRWYDAARKRERAAARIPRLLRSADRERASLESLRRRIEGGEATQEEVGTLARTGQRDRRAAPTTLPYRAYRTSGGHEVRVGRSSKANDDLTFHHAAPDDIWMHAESVPGAHVVLRWGRRAENPPALDLHEAAVLAALHSRARTSGTVPVTWTRRKYVRKPRKAPPGVVLVERGRTIFVEPNEEVERSLRRNP